MLARLHVPLTLALLTLLGFVVFPGHTWLQSDTQIYAPIHEHLDNPATFAHDEVALRPHVTYTLYDEITIALRRLTRLDFGVVLPAQQLLFRLAGVAGAYLLALSLGLTPPGALLAAAAFALGAVVNGPSVLTFEYEPVPRGFAFSLIIGALGCLVQRRMAWAGVLAVAATLYHPTTTAPFWGCLALHWLFQHDQREKIVLFASVAAAGAGLVLLAWCQVSGLEPQVWLGRIGPQLEQIQRLRGPYNWIGQWPTPWLRQYPLLLVFVLAAWWRLRDAMNFEARFFTLALPIYGLLMIPAQYLLLDKLKWILMPQFQPARAVIWITSMAIILGVAAAWRAAAARRWPEAALWLAPVFALPVNGLIFDLFTSLNGPRLAAVALLAALVLAASLRPRLAAPAALVFCLIPPHVAGIRNYPELHTPELHDLAGWAAHSTPPDAVFVFAGVGHDLAPGIFRAQSQRALYVDWKSGGQANLLPVYAGLWWQRWQAIGEAKPPVAPLNAYARLGIHYLVVPAKLSPSGATPAYENPNWAVYALNQTR
jgi:hypothetical protein